MKLASCNFTTIVTHTLNFNQKQVAKLITNVLLSMGMGHEKSKAFAIEDDIADKKVHPFIYFYVATPFFTKIRHIRWFIALNMNR